MSMLEAINECLQVTFFFCNDCLYWKACKTKTACFSPDFITCSIVLSIEYQYGSCLVSWPYFHPFFSFGVFDRELILNKSLLCAS